MTENAFATTHRILSETSNAYDDLRIIASDVKKLSDLDRDIIRHAADELETAQRTLVHVYRQLMECNAHRIALNEQLIDARKVPMVFPSIAATITNGVTDGRTS